MSQHHHFHVLFYKWIVGFYVCSLLLLEVSTPPVFKCLFAVFYLLFQHHYQDRVAFMLLYDAIMCIMF